MTIRQYVRVHAGVGAGRDLFTPASTAYRMLMGWAPHTVRKGDVVLIWGASGGLGSMAIQIVKAEGGIPVGEGLFSFDRTAP